MNSRLNLEGKFVVLVSSLVFFLLIPSVSAFVGVGSIEGETFRIGHGNSTELSYSLSRDDINVSAHSSLPGNPLSGDINGIYGNESAHSFKVSVREGTPPGKYSHRLVFIDNETDFITTDFSVRVPPDKSYEIEHNKSIVASANSKGVELYEINNTGNAELEAEGELLPAGRTTYLPLSWEAGSSVGKKNISRVVEINGNNEKLRLFIDVSDDEKPVITETIHEISPMVKEEYRIEAYLTDNMGIDSVWYELEGENVTMKDENKDDDENHYAADYTIEDINTNSMMVYANDTSGNLVSETLDFETEKSDVLEVYESQYVGIKEDFKATERVLSSSREVPVELEVKKFNFIPEGVAANETENVTPSDHMTLTLKTPEGSVDIDSDFQQDFVIDGDVFLELVGKDRGEYDIEVEFEFSDWVEADDQIYNLQGTVDDFKMPKNRTINIGGIEQDCYVDMNNDSLEDSYYKCVRNLPLSANLERMSVTMTQREYDMIDEKHENEVEDLETSLSSVSLQRSILVIVFILFAIGLGLYKGFEKMPIKIKGR